MSETSGVSHENLVQENLFSFEDGEGVNLHHTQLQLGLDGNPIGSNGRGLQTYGFGTVETKEKEQAKRFQSAGSLTLQPKEGNTDTPPHLYDVFQALIWTQGDDFAGLGERGAVKKLRDRVLMFGVGSLSNAELFALVLSTGEGSESVLGRIYKLLENHSFVNLMRIDIGELLKKHRLGEAKATQLLSLLEIARRLSIPQANEKYQIRSPADAARLMIPEMGFLDHEELRVLVLDTKNCVVANILLYRGTVNSSVVRTAEVFKHAITRTCPGIMIFHNHPSGSVEPSQEDIAVTNQIVEAGKLVEVELIDHLIIGGQNFLSLKEKLRWT